MKIGILFVFAVAAMFLMPMVAFAEEDTTAATDEMMTIAEEDNSNSEPNLIATNEVAEDVDPGTTPDSAFYGLDVAMDKLKLKLARNAEKRAQLRLDIAKERLAEMKKMADENKDAAMEKARERHSEVLEGMDKDMSEIEDKDKLTGIENGMANHIAAMEKVRAKVEANENLSAEQKAKLLEKIDSRITNAEELKEKILERKEERAKKLAEAEKVEAEDTETKETAEASEISETSEKTAETSGEAEQTTES